ncbi:RelA/SpoT domain-containing protein [Nitrosomonas oligotropha]|uniref:RelA/SpoT domain-containing protein n=1 Tax=Nitrosomonas oligotropha TaxID=42354 RepID=UPI00136ED346|nr:addiction module component [Nitrosomonas oligotropha]MXS84177.1 addiction module component [Nitrosomonas oligotropha]
MIKIADRDSFLAENSIDIDTWAKAKIEWEVLEEIYNDYLMQFATLESAARVIANTIQKFPNVHSVRWRVKDPNHLISKIIRKKSTDNPKYAEISKDNYLDIITDLIGVRALHLFKKEWEEINQYILDTWDLKEEPKAYIRSGDNESLQETFKLKNIKIEEHSAGYRSIHYVINSKPFKKEILVEIQVRTIFEEGWSEIDHKIKYPNYSNNPLIIYFLEIFNRMAGSADDMGGFVIGLSEALLNLEDELHRTKAEKDATINVLENALKEIDKEKVKNTQSTNVIEQLKNELEKQKSAYHSQHIGLLGRHTSEELDLIRPQIQKITKNLDAKSILDSINESLNLNYISDPINKNKKG